MTLIAIRLVVLAIMLCAVGTAEGQTTPRRFKQADYETYFVPGRYETWSPAYSSRGELEVVSVEAPVIAGVRTLRQHFRTLDVHASYDHLSDHPFTKIQSDAMDPMVWDTARAAYLFRFSREAFDSARSQIWESRNDRVEISREDIPRGNLQAYYRAADVRAGRDAEALRNQHREDKVGDWSKACGYLEGQSYEVVCAYTHLPTGRAETYYYRRAGLVS